MFIFLERQRGRLNQWLKKKTTIDFSDWGVFILFLEGLFAIIYLNKAAKIADIISAVVLWFTAIAILQYTKETYWLKQIQNKQIKELRKSRCLEKMPMIRIVSMDIEKKPPIPKVDPSRIPPIKDKNFYKIIYKNIGEDWAFINSITMWVGNPAPEKEIVFEEHAFKKTLFRNEEDIVVTYNIEKKQNGELLLFPRKIEISFSDRYGNNFVYKAEKILQLAEPTPFLGVRDYIKEEIQYPSNLR